MKITKLALLSATFFVASSAMAASVTLLQTSFESPVNDTGFSKTLGTGSVQWTLSTVSGQARTGSQHMRWEGAATTHDAYLDTPALSATGIVSGTVKVEFWHKYNFENGFDGGMLQYTKDGTTFFDVALTDITGEQYSLSTINTAWGSPIAGKRAYTGLRSNYVQTIATLSNVMEGEAFALRWRATSDSIVTNSGPDWQIDDLHVYGEAVPEPATMTVLALAALARRRKAKKS